MYVVPMEITWKYDSNQTKYIKLIILGPIYLSRIYPFLTNTTDDYISNWFVWNMYNFARNVLD